MKNFLLFVVATLFFANNSFATKTKSISTNFDTKISASAFEKKGTDSIGEIEIQPFDFDKLMSEAEKYFKAAKNWEKIKCEPKTGFLCSKWECNPRETKAYTILDKKAKNVTRCEHTSCETFDAEFEQTGVFVNVQAKGPIGTLIRVLGDNRYKEITTVGLDAYIANGNCEIFTEEKITDLKPTSK